MRKALSVVGLVVLAFLILISGLAGGVALDRLVLTRVLPVGSNPLAALTGASASSSIPADASADFQLMAEAWNTIHQYYVDQAGIQNTDLTYGAISGMTDALGDTGHSRFLSPQMVTAEHNFNQGELEGIGAYVEMKDGNVVIVAPIDGSPAQKAGLRPGDVILKVDGRDISGLPLDQVVSLIKGPAGTSVTLTITTPSTGQTRDETLVRARIPLIIVTWHTLPGTQIAHLRISTFSKGATDQLKTALTQILQQGLTGIVLDLRSNPGGLLDEAVGVASQFLTSGNVLLEKNAQGQTTPVQVQKGALAPNIPMVVLINEGTASAAEIVAGALHDAGRAKLVGETTFGTGTVLNEFPLSDGSALLLATEEWLTPDGSSIWHKGITPDVQVALAQGASPLLPEAEPGMTPQQLKDSGDTQLLRALQLLGSSALRRSLR